jgi:hypothetical protein
MLVTTMNPPEVAKEVFTDYENIIKSVERLGIEYDRERRKKKVDKKARYSVAYPIKTKRKDTWIVFLSKAPAVSVYKGEGDINVKAVVYYRNTVGLRVFSIGATGGLHVYNGHLFSRYRERIGLTLSDPVDVVKVFFMNNGYTQGQVIRKDGREYTLNVCRDGFLLGELQHGRRWLVHRTFISRDLTTPEQEEQEKNLIAHMQQEIIAELNKPDFDEQAYNLRADIMKGINS